MLPFPVLVPQKSCRGVLLDHFATLDDPRDASRIAHPRPRPCRSWSAPPWPTAITGTTSPPGEPPTSTSRAGHQPYEHGTPGGRWLTLLINRISPALFSADFTA